MAKKSVLANKPDEIWRAEADLHTLMEAEKIKKDPKRMAKVRAMAQKKMMEVASIASEGKDESCPQPRKERA